MPHITSWQWMDKSAFILFLMLCQLFLTTAASKWFADADFYVLLFNLLKFSLITVTLAICSGCPGPVSWFWYESEVIKPVFNWNNFVKYFDKF